MVGNGLDLHLGLKTRYSDFYSWHKEHYPNVHNQIFDAIDKDKADWADYESGWCKYCRETLGSGGDEASVDAQESFLDASDEVSRELRFFLLEQIKELKVPAVRERTEIVNQTLLHLLSGLQTDDVSDINSKINKLAASHLSLEIVDFNYTN